MTQRLPAIIYFMAIAGGLGAANLHYSQPLLPAIAASLDTNVAVIQLLPAVTQLGFAIGILGLLPLADILERRSLIVTLLCLVSVALSVHGAAGSVVVLYLGGFLVGLAGVVPQLLTPFASIVSPAGRAGSAVGMVLSGVLIGVLISKVISGLVTEFAGWRQLYFSASAVMLLLAIGVRFILPLSQPTTVRKYGDILRSTWRMAAREPRILRHAMNGGLTFACFMSFWATYALYLYQTYGYGPGIAGLFGLVGLAGAIAANLAGRAVDSNRFRQTFAVAAVLLAGGFVLMIFSQFSLAFMILGVLIMDAGAGMSHAANQSAAFSINADARGQINSVYMSGYFLGGAIGTFVSTQAYFLLGWYGVCGTGGFFGAAALASACLRVTPTNDIKS